MSKSLDRHFDQLMIAGKMHAKVYRLVDCSDNLPGKVVEQGNWDIKWLDDVKVVASVDVT